MKRSLVSFTAFCLIGGWIAFGKTPSTTHIAPPHTQPAMAQLPPEQGAEAFAIVSVTVTPTPTPTPMPAPRHVPGSREDWLARAGIPQAVWSCAIELVSRESSWNHTAVNPSSQAYGLPQALPAEKMASAGSDWAVNPVTQLRWMKGYVEGRYGGFCQALSFHDANNWY